MKKFAIGLSLAALGIGGVALAEQAAAPGSWGDGTATRAEALARAGQMFSRLDANRDGKLDTADREARRTAAFDRIDGNKDGQISRAEFAAMRPGMAGDRMGGRHGGDHQGGQGMRGHRMGGMMLMHMADSNRDGTVTKDEFAAAAATRFDAADTNRDGQLTPAERQAARGAMRERMRAMMQHQPADGAPKAPPAAQ